MTTYSYLEYALTLLGWIISNGIWDTITATGLFALPLLMKLLSLWLKAREQGADEGDAGGLTLAWMENTIYVALLVIMFTCVPLLNIDITQMKYNTDRSKQCNFTMPVAPEPAQYTGITVRTNISWLRGQYRSYLYQCSVTNRRTLRALFGIAGSIPGI